MKKAIFLFGILLSFALSSIAGNNILTMKVNPEGSTTFSVYGYDADKEVLLNALEDGSYEYPSNFIIRLKEGASVESWTVNGIEVKDFFGGKNQLPYLSQADIKDVLNVSELSGAIDVVANIKNLVMYKVSFGLHEESDTESGVVTCKETDSFFGNPLINGEKYEGGMNIKFVAEAAQDYIFDSWYVNGEKSAEKSNELAMCIDKDLDVKAKFVKQSDIPESSSIFKETFDTESAFNKFLTIDANDDYNTWTWNDNGSVDYMTNFFDGLPGDDWLISPAIKLEKGKKYVLKLDVKADDEQEKVAIMIGKEQTVEAMNIVVQADKVVEAQSNETLTNVFEVNEDGEYYVGIHCISDPDKWVLNVDNLIIELGPTSSAPEAVNDLKVIANADGKLAAVVEFTVPSKYVDGSDIANIDYADIYRGEQMIKRFDKPAPGEKLSYADNESEQGFIKYSVVVASNGSESVSVTETAFVGEDVPNPVTDITFEVVNGKMQISWTAPETGYNGYQINKENIKYEIYRYIDDVNREIVSQEFVGTTISDDELDIELGSQRNITYGVYAKNTIDKSPIAFSSPIVVGKSYPTPFKETVADSKLQNSYWSLTINSDKAMVYASNESQDGDNGSLMLTSELAGDEMTLHSGKIAVKGIDDLTLSFYHRSNVGEQLTVMFVKDNTVLYSMPLSYEGDGASWQHEEVLFNEVEELASCSEKDYIQILFNVKFGENPCPVYIDNILLASQCALSIEGVSSTEATDNIYYGIDGVRHDGLQKGLNVVKMSDGTVKKIIVK